MGNIVAMLSSQGKNEGRPEKLEKKVMLKLWNKSLKNVKNTLSQQ